MTEEAANPDDAHRPLEKSHNLASSLSYVETRQVRNDYTFRWDGKLFQIERQAILTGLRGAAVRVEKRLDSSLAVRYQDRYLPVKECAVADKAPRAEPVKPPKNKSKASRDARRRSDWDKNFDLKKGPKVWQAAQASGRLPEEAIG